jgi:hypothetical protein
LQEDFRESTLSLSQRAYLISSLLGTFGKYFRKIIVFNLIFLSLGWIFIYTNTTNLFAFVIAELSIATLIGAVDYLLTGRRAYRQLKEWNEDYLEQAYFLVFDTTIPQGNTIGEKVFNLARVIFPELRLDYINFLPPLDNYVIKSYFKRKFGRSKVDGIVKNLDYRVNSYSLFVAQTVKGYFIVNDFKDKVIRLEDLSHLAEVIRRKFKDKYQRTHVFRVICVAREYDQSFLQHESLEYQMKEKLKANFPIDLLIEEKIGYSVLWVDY